MEFDIDVLVAGAGPAGLALALELGRRGVKVLVAERSPHAGAAPRAKTTNLRTRTHLRRWRIADRLAQASPLGVDGPSPIQALAAIDTDVVCPTAEKREALSRYVQAFGYEFSEPNPAQGSLLGPPLPGRDYGEYHTSDLPSVFGVSAPDGVRVTAKHLSLSRKIIKYRTSLARAGKP